MGSINLIFYIFFLILIIYCINIKLTVNVLKKEILRYKKIIVGYKHKELNANDINSINEKYNNVLKNINALRTDILDTNFLNNESIKNDLLMALENIDIYEQYE